MRKRPTKLSANHLRAWREYRGYSQEELAALVDTKGNVIGLLESGERGLSDKWLKRLAPHLGTSPGFILDHDPNDVDTELLQLVDELADTHKSQVIQILKTFQKTAS